MGNVDDADYADYAEFWRRGIAFIIDMILMAAAILIYGYALFGILSGGVCILNMLIASSILLGRCIYHASEYQATPGKMLMGIYVVNIDRTRISFSQALAREILTIGFPIMIFMPHKQAPHDFIMKTVVLRRKSRVEFDPFFDTKITPIDRRMTSIVSSQKIGVDRELDFYGGSSPKPYMSEPQKVPPVKKAPPDKQW